MKITTETAVGGRSHQEDRFVVAEDNGILLAVVDGHRGCEVSEFVAQNLVRIFASSKGQSAQNRLQATFDELQSFTKHNRAGSTLSIVWIPQGQQIAHIGILGDSPVIVKNPGQESWISPEHNVRTNVKDREDAIDHGGVYDDGYIWNRSGNSCLQLSRALGGAQLDGILNRKPEIFSIPIQSGCVVILATDGILDPSHQETAAQVERLLQIVAKNSDARSLVEDALQRRTGDNATAIICVVD